MMSETGNGAHDEQHAGLQTSFALAVDKLHSPSVVVGAPESCHAFQPPSIE
jgi:hypothetical protein